MIADFFSWLDLDQISFWIGFLTGVVFLWVLYRARPVFRLAGTVALDRLRGLRENLTTSTENRLRADVLKTVQRRHIAHPLCSLDEILIQPKIQLPAPRFGAFAETPEMETVEGLLPFLPEFTSFGAAFSYPSQPIGSLFFRGGDILLLGPAGAGKTVALAHLASQLARQDPKLEELASSLPVFIDAVDLLEIPAEGKSSFELCLAAVTRYASTLTQTRLAYVLKNAMESGRAVLIVDSVDELPPAQVLTVSHWLRELRQEHPNFRMIVAASPHNYDGLMSLNLQPAGMIGWDRQDKRSLFDRWQVIWQEIVHNQPINPFNAIDSLILANWLGSTSYMESPLAYTLRLWALSAGDLLGPNDLTSIEAYVRRSIQDFPDSRTFLSRFAYRLVQDMKPALPRSELHKLAADIIPVPVHEPEPESDQTDESSEHSSYTSPSGRMINSLVSAGILRTVGTDSIAFANDLFCAYLTCEQFLDTEAINHILSQPRWEKRQQSLWLLAATQDISAPLMSYLDQDDAPIETNLVESGIWLQFAHRANAWADQVLRLLATQLQNSAKTRTYRFRIVGALAACENKGTDVLFRKMLQQYEPDTRLLGCFGSGLLQDVKALPELKSLLSDQDAAVRQAACLALGAIGGTQAMEMVAMGLLQSDEALQKCAAEMLARDPGEGHATLQEGSEFDDLLVRRAVVHGLKKVNTDWSHELLARIHLEDSQWVVRNAAEQAMEQLESLHPSIPAGFPELMNTPWIIEYAGEQGLGVATDAAARDLLIQAIQHGDPEYRLYALQRIPYLVDLSPDAVAAIYSAYYGENGEIRETAYRTLWLIGGRQIELPQPMQYGYF